MADIKEIREAFNKSEEDLLREWYEQEMRQAVGRSSDVLRSVPGGDLKLFFLSWFSQKGLQDLVCKQWDYCTKRNQFQDPINLAASLVDLLIAHLGIIAPANIAVLAVRFYCNHLCQCD